MPAVPAVVLEQESDVMKVCYCDRKGAGRIACSCEILFRSEIWKGKMQIRKK